MPSTMSDAFSRVFLDQPAVQVNAAAVQFLARRVEQLEADFRILLANARQLAAHDHVVLVPIDVVRAVGRDGDPRQSGKPDVVEADLSLQVAPAAAPHVESDHRPVDRFVARINRLDADRVPAVGLRV